MNRRKPLGYILPITLYLLLSALYLFAIPIGESPDEPSHLQCVEQVARYGRFPVIEKLPQGENWWDRERIISDMECYHMPLYYLGAGLVQRVVELVSGERLQVDFPPNNPDFPHTAAIFLHPKTGRVFNASEPAFVLVLRLASVLLGMFSLIATYVLTEKLTEGNRLAAAFATTLVAGWPLLLFVSRAINNDVLGTALAAGVLIALVSSNHANRFIWASAFSALAILSKFTMLASALVVMCAFVIEWISTNSDRQRFIKPAVFSLLIYVGVTVFIFMQPTVRLHLEQSQAGFSDVSQAAVSIDYWIDVIRTTMQSGWGRFGWMNISTPDWQVLVWWGFLAVTGVIGVAKGLSRPLKSAGARITLASSLWVGSFLISYFRINLNRFQPQFRFILPVIPVLAAYAAFGLFALLDRYPRWQRPVVPLVGAALLLANVWIVVETIGPNYR